MSKQCTTTTPCALPNWQCRYPKCVLGQADRGRMTQPAPSETQTPLTDALIADGPAIDAALKSHKALEIALTQTQEQCVELAAQRDMAIAEVWKLRAEIKERTK